MIRHVYSDGSEGYEYELGDLVEITGTVHGGWFNHSVGKTGPVVKLGRWFGRTRSGERSRSWCVDPLYVRHSSDWGPSHCMPWQVKPTPETYAGAAVVMEGQ